MRHPRAGAFEDAPSRCEIKLTARPTCSRRRRVRALPGDFLAPLPERLGPYCACARWMHLARRFAKRFLLHARSARESRCARVSCLALRFTLAAGAVEVSRPTDGRARGRPEDVGLRSFRRAAVLRGCARQWRSARRRRAARGRSAHVRVIHVESIILIACREPRRRKEEHVVAVFTRIKERRFFI